MCYQGCGHILKLKDAEIMGKTMKLVAVMIILAVQANAQEVLIEPSRVISVVTSDWNDDGLMDRAVLYDGGTGDAALAVYFSDTYGEWRIVGFDPQNAWFGGWGQLPELSLDEGGNLVVTSMNIGTGRSRWQMDLTLVFMDKAFVVKTYKYEDYDSLDPENSGTCEVDFLSGTGRGQRGEAPLKPFKFFASVIVLGEWSYQDVPKECG
jgi:hypothetical protein